MDFAKVPIENVKSYWDKRPCNIRHSTKPVGTKEYFDEVEARKYFVEPHIPGFAEFERWNGKKVLEIGCGLGTDTINFARAGATVTAVDLSTESLNLAKQRAEVMGLADKITFYNCNSEELSKTVPVETYDLIYSFGVLHHTPHPDVALAEIRKYAKPGTEIKIMMYYKWSWKVFWILAQEGFRFDQTDALIAKHSEAQTGCPVTYIYTKKTLTEYVERQGFEVKDIFVDHIFPYFIPDYVKYIYRFEWFFAWMPKPLFRWLEKRFGWHVCVTAVAH
ncbi:MAG: class I SAM-dependent methyltransferase [Alphaproteobacteria bacterium]|nr:class I SAM-dependent methyltransferase [Alphaproteobacteria bacterium]